MQRENRPAADYVDIYRAETDRLRALTEFLRCSVQAPRDDDDKPDSDVIAAYNATIEVVLQKIRQLAIEA